MNATGFRIGPVAPAGTALRGSLEECLELLPTALADEVTITQVTHGEATLISEMRAVRSEGEWRYTPWTEHEEAA